jgi:hypothetical protein
VLVTYGIEEVGLIGVSNIEEEGLIHRGIGYGGMRYGYGFNR